MAAQRDIADDALNHAHDVFISYAHLDADHDMANAVKLGEWLYSEGYDVWWDRSLLRGNVQKQLVRKAQNAQTVIALWSSNAERSKYVFVECVLAATNETLIPLILDEEALPSEWTDLLYIKLTNFEAQKAEIRSRLPPPSRKRHNLIIPEDERISLAGLPTPARTFIGREDELEKLATAWGSTTPGAAPTSKTNIFVLHAIGGAGKSATVRQFLDMLAGKQFDGAHKVYSWSAYSQGSGDNRAASADEFIAKALAFFGHDLTYHPIQDAVERGRKLAALVGTSRSLLILDGLEPLQDAPHINGGRLKDRGLAALVKGLADYNKGLLIVTSRQELPELPAKHEPRIISDELNQMGMKEGIMLLVALGVDGKRREIERAVEEVLGHALSLNLLGAYLSAVHAGDVNGREHLRLRRIKDVKADSGGDETIRYAKRATRIIEGTLARVEKTNFVTAAILRGLARQRIRLRGWHGTVETAILHMVGLFDRPVEREALEALLAEPAIPGLTEVFHAPPSAERRARWNVAVGRLRKLKLIAAEDRHKPGALDAHPIVRAHFGGRLKARAPEAYAQAHGRLYDFYRYRGLPQAFRMPETYSLLAVGVVDAEENVLRKIVAVIGPVALQDALTAFLPDSLDDMRHCFAAITHGCAAGRHRDAYREVYGPRMRRGNKSFIIQMLGAPNANLAALAHFFDVHWSTPAAGLGDIPRDGPLNFAGFCLRALGRTREAIEAYSAAIEIVVARSDWRNACADASNVSDLHLTLGDIAEAIAAARDCIAYAEKSGDGLMRTGYLTTLADTLHQDGEAAKALKVFEEAEAMQAERQPDLPKLYSIQGYRYCDLLLATGQSQAAIKRANSALKAYGAYGHNNLLSHALDRVTLGRANAILAQETAQPEPTYMAEEHLDDAVERLCRAGQEDYLPRGLLARAAFRRSQGDFSGAAPDLAEAQEIACHGGMRLHIADYHLESARLVLAQLAVTSDASLRAEAETHQAEAAKLIAATGYKRRLAELDAIRACLDGAIPAKLLAPDRDSQGRPIWHDLAPAPV